MSRLTVLENIDLIPVIELEPEQFSTCERPLPYGSALEVPSQWSHYWLDSLSDAGVVGLTPLRPASWLVPIQQLVDPIIIERIIEALLRSWGGEEVLSDPDHISALDGGLALFSREELLIEPTCCADLRNLFNWWEAVEYRDAAWKMIWIGHPWISVCFDDGLLILTEPYEAAEPAARWAVSPDDLSWAVTTAMAALEDFARRLRQPLEAFGGKSDAAMLSLKLAGLMP